MSESFWEPETTMESPADAREAPDAEQSQPIAKGRAFTVSAVDFSALEERILRAVDVVKQERQARMAAEAHAAQAETQVREQALLMEQLQRESDELKAERDRVRQRVERLLKQLDALEV